MDAPGPSSMRPEPMEEGPGAFEEILNEAGFPPMDLYLPSVVLAEIASKLPHLDFIRFRSVSRNCYHACEAKTNTVEKFDFECTKNGESTLKAKATPDERQYFLTANGEVVVPKSYPNDDGRAPTLKTFTVERGVRHFFNRILSNRPQHVFFNITHKYIGITVCNRVDDEIERIAAEGNIIYLRKFTLYVDSVARYRLLTNIFAAMEYEIHGCTAHEILINDLGPNVRNCPLNVQIDQFSVDIRQLNAKHLYLWDVTLHLDDFVQYLRNRTRMKSGLVMQFNIVHDDHELDIQQIVETERKRLNPVGTKLLEYTVFLAKPKNTIVQHDGHLLTTIQFRWHVINTKAPWLSARQYHNN